MAGRPSSEPASCSATSAPERAGTPDDREALFAPFWDAFEAITGTFVGETDEKTLVEGAIKGMFEAIGDPFSSYLTSEEYRTSLSGISGSFEGIGAVMMTRDEAGEEGCASAGPTCHIVVVRTLRDAPATRAGLRADDRILAVDDVPVDGQTLGETIDRVRGPRGTTVRLSVSRGAAEPFELAIVRDVIQTEVVTSQLLADGTVGYIRLDGFSSSAADDFRDQLKALVDDGVTGIVFDLRGDPGGFVDAAERIASEFIASGPIFWEAFADGSETAHEAIPGGVATDPGIAGRRPRRRRLGERQRDRRRGAPGLAVGRAWSGSRPSARAPSSNGRRSPTTPAASASRSPSG